VGPLGDGEPLLRGWVDERLSDGERQDVAAMAEDGKEVDFARARDFLGREGGRLLVRVLREMRAGTVSTLSRSRLL
jgi:hypothetical protein